MASRIIEGAAFSPDVLAFLRLLAQHRVRYLVVGGEAVIYHGYPRVTGGVDFFYENTSGNTAVSSVHCCNFGTPASPASLQRTNCARKE